MQPRLGGVGAGGAPVRAGGTGTNGSAARRSTSGAPSRATARASPSPSPSPSPSDVAAQDRHADSGSDDDRDDGDDERRSDGGGSEDGDADDGVPDDVDQVDASGRVINDGEELLDLPVPAVAVPRRSSAGAGFGVAGAARLAFAEVQQAAASGINVSRAAAYTPSALIGSGELTDGDGSSSARRAPIYLCPSSYGRPATVYFDYPQAFGMKRPQEKSE